MYILQFVVFPFFFDDFFPQSNESTIFIAITSLIIFIGEMIFITDNLFILTIGNIVYAMLILLFSRNGAYGIGLRGITLDGNQSSFDMSVMLIDVLILLAVYFVLQIIIYCIVKPFKKNK